MKKKKKLFILSDGRVYFDSVVPFAQATPIILNLTDCFMPSNWTYFSDRIKKIIKK
jgi:hypothetical protein|uniref:Uncharacterized protein n=1 Tax=Heterosigma akashiwo TaxID=2829 RepID=D2Z243_HETAK|nr:hypothetical protein HeakM_p12 [Heterosigma akashiwo]AOT84778.1 hypothetical protein [Heterosigma akashiwo]AOT84820.1 hypothetical protein [Heterosigma akashiwo]AOT84862.1 hypothetical protein [Heterosigma akashiwo]BAI70607.1 hypothetical protein [Heterosigma akashiwo]